MITLRQYRRMFRCLGFFLLLLIPALSLTPMPEMQTALSNDKYQHVLAYFALTFCFVQFVSEYRRRVVLALGFVALGVLIEYIQPHVNRQFDYVDMAMNAIGVSLGLLFGAAFYRIKTLFLKRDPDDAPSSV